jgi:UDPglucose 6-dehydrogenase
VHAYDPAITKLDGQDGAGIDTCADPYLACAGATVLVVLAEWDEFRWLDFDRLMGIMAAPRIVDARNLLEPAALRRIGFTYEGIGR